MTERDFIDSVVKSIGQRLFRVRGSPASEDCKQGINQEENKQECRDSLFDTDGAEEIIFVPLAFIRIGLSIV